MRALCAHLSLIGLCYFIRTCSKEDECNWQNKWQDPDNGCLSVHFCTLISAGEDIQTQSNGKNSCLTCGYKEKDECNGIIIRIIRRIYDRMFSASNINGHEVFLCSLWGRVSRFYCVVLVNLQPVILMPQLETTGVYEHNQFLWVEKAKEQHLNKYFIIFLKWLHWLIIS